MGDLPDRWTNHRPPLVLRATTSVLKVNLPPTSSTPRVEDVAGSSSQHGVGNTDRPNKENRHPWMPKMDFLKFDGSDVRIWVDTCNTFFQLYNIAEGFKVSAATMYMHDSAARWYQAYKLENPWHNWATFSVDVVQEFEGNAERDRIRELLILKQTGTVEEYKKQFDKLVYQIRLYDPHVGGMMLVQ